MGPGYVLQLLICQKSQNLLITQQSQMLAKKAQILASLEILNFGYVRVT